jgi:hypothetical protein
MNARTSKVTVVDLAASLDRPVAEVLDAARDLGIEAESGGSELGSADADRVRRSLSGIRRGMVPTSAGSVPSLVAASDAAADAAGAADGAASSAVPSSFRVPGAAPLATEVAAAPAPVRRPPLDPSVRPAVVAAGIAVVSLVVGELVGSTALLYVLTPLALLTSIVAVVSGNRARYHITNHPEKHRGLAFGVGALAIGLVLLVGFGLTAWAVVRSQPAADLPLGLGKTTTVEKLRWSYQRFRLLEDNGWHRPAPDAGSCFSDHPANEEAVESDGRSAFNADRIACSAEHRYEVLGVYAVDPKPDVAYDVASVRTRAMARCKAEFSDRLPAGAQLQLDVPTAASWDRADHDVSCLYVGVRKGSVLD